MGIKKAKTVVKRGPALVWNSARDRALVQAIADGVTRGEDLVAALKEDPAFTSDVEAVTIEKVRIRINKLRAIGVNIPKLARAWYEPDVGDLNALLG